jgi:uncharacterized membrane protein YfcA
VNELLVISTVSFITSFIFSLGGLGSAVALIPILVFLGVPFSYARSAGLLTNTISTVSASLHNLKEGLVDFRLALPIAISSLLFAPVGAYASHFFPEKLVAGVFTAFLFFAGIMVYIPKKKGYREKAGVLLPFLVGALSGFLSGFLGIGGGGIISPILVTAGFNPKKVAPVTAFVVPFSSLAAFLTYLKLGSVNWGIALAAALPALLAGYLGALVTHRYLKPSQVKKLLALIFFILGIKFLTKFF